MLTPLRRADTEGPVRRKPAAWGVTGTSPPNRMDQKDCEENNHSPYVYFLLNPLNPFFPMNRPGRRGAKKAGRVGRRRRRRARRAAPLPKPKRFPAQVVTCARNHTFA